MRKRLLLLAITFAACEEGEDPPASGVSAATASTLEQGLAAVRVAHGYTSLSVAIFEPGAATKAVATGSANASTGKAASTDTIYMMASCSKPVVGLAIARLVEQKKLSLDTDIGTWLDWTPRHPKHPTVPITLRHLATHRAGIAADGPDDYKTYPKPNPSQPLGAYLKAELAKPEFWIASAPGAAESYSNTGTALAAYVVERADGRPFSTFCNEEIFGPLGMADTRWHFSELSPQQQARVAHPHAEGQTLQHYSFNDWPSGSLRTTPTDFAKLWRAVAAGGAHEGKPVFSSAELAVFHSVPLFIVPDAGSFEHSGGEEGITAWFSYKVGGRGVVYVANSDLSEETEDAAHNAVAALLAKTWPTP